MKRRIPDGRSLTLGADSFAQSTKSNISLIKANTRIEKEGERRAVQTRGSKRKREREEEQKRRAKQGRAGEANWMQAKWFNLQRREATVG